MDEKEKRTFDNTSNAYLSLKAELLRKKQDVQKSAAASTSSATMLDDLQLSSSSLRMKSNHDLDIEIVNRSKKKKKNEETIVEPAPSSSASSALIKEDEIAFAKSRAILEAKAKLYEEIMSNSEMRVLAEDAGDDDKDDKSFLVDFERKMYETNDKVEYTDSFGRTRLVTREEYDQIQLKEKKQSHESSRSSNISESEINRVERLHREKMRSKWESEMEEIRNKTHLHYQDLLFDEKREHGVGYFQFSTDDKQRSEQMATLNQLRTDTVSEQAKFNREKDKREIFMNERLNKIRLRKAKEMGIDLSQDNSTDKKISTDIKNDNIPQSSSDKNQDNSNEVKFQHQISSTSKLPEPTITQTPQNQQQTPIEDNNNTLRNSNPSMIYPFPIIRSHAELSTSDKR